MVVPGCSYVASHVLCEKDEPILFGESSSSTVCVTHICLSSAWSSYGSNNNILTVTFNTLFLSRVKNESTSVLNSSHPSFSKLTRINYSSLPLGLSEILLKLNCGSRHFAAVIEHGFYGCTWL